MKFSDDQIQQLKEVFATKDDISGLASKEDLKSFATIETVSQIIKKELKPIKRTLAAIRKYLNWTMLKYDARLVHLETHLIHPPGRAAN